MNKFQGMFEFHEYSPKMRILAMPPLMLSKHELIVRARMAQAVSRARISIQRERKNQRKSIRCDVLRNGIWMFFVLDRLAAGTGEREERGMKTRIQGRGFIYLTSMKI